jgi:hypothetical protein
MEQITLIPQTQIFTVIPQRNPLHELAKKYPLNMCWLTALFYALQYLGFKNSRSLHYKLSNLLGSSFGLLFVSKDNGALYFPKKYELSDAYIRSSLNEIFRKSSLKIRVIEVLSDIKFAEIEKIETALALRKELLCIVRNNNLAVHGENIIGEVVNHSVLLKQCKNLQNGRVQVTFLDPADARLHVMEIGVNVFMQWIQYVWVLERRITVFERIISIMFRRNKR